jgi:hypothetical protein
MDLSVFKVCVTSTCGSYFRQYLQSVTVIAPTKEEALAIAVKEHGSEFIRPPKLSDVDCLGAVKVGVIDTHSDSDY